MEKENIVTRLVYKRKDSKFKIIRKILTKVIALFGLIIPEDVVIGENVKFAHNAIGSVIAHNTVIGDNVTIYQNVTLGRAEVLGDNDISIVVNKNSIICAGAKVLAKDVLEIGESSVIAANAVLLNSIGKNEIWGGVPAHFLRQNNTEINVV